MCPIQMDPSYILFLSWKLKKVIIEDLENVLYSSPNPSYLQSHSLSM